MKRRAVHFVVLISCLVFGARAARASEAYPRVMAEVYKLPSEPECTLCHATVKGGNDTITTELGKDLYARGARGKNPDLLQDALVEAAYDRQDSDGDGATDLTELRSGTDPNREGDAVPNEGSGGVGGELDLGSLEALPPLPAHGCGMARTTFGSGLLSLACVALAVALRRRRSEPAL
jgi:hypothetical protein